MNLTQFALMHFFTYCVRASGKFTIPSSFFHFIPSPPSMMTGDDAYSYSRVYNLHNAFPNHVSIVIGDCLKSAKKKSKKNFLLFHSLTAIKTLKSLLSVMSHTWMLLTGQFMKNAHTMPETREKNLFFRIKTEKKKMSCIYFDY
jgi:hypothetical protein